MLTDKILTLFSMIFSYFFYRRKYKINPLFRFNGYFIRFYGDGEFVSGDNSYIGFYSYINLSKGTKVNIGSNVSISHNVKIYTSNIDTEKMIKTGVQDNIYGDVMIGDNVLIGANVFICPSVVIGNNVVVGANSVVTKSIPDNSVAGGVPAKVIKTHIGFSKNDI
ncbi:MAG: maltose O-acetyltransferase [Polaribacter sp.]|jgi:maltose O-acetyltransferase